MAHERFDSICSGARVGRDGAGDVAPIHAEGHRPARAPARPMRMDSRDERSEEHTSELQSLMRISYAVFCLKKKKKNETNNIALDNKRKDHNIKINPGQNIVVQ